jgi:uncharacterized protein YxeA
MGKVCAKCQHDNNAGAIYCENCNEKLSILGSARTKDKEPPKEGSSNLYEEPPKGRSIKTGKSKTSSDSEGSGCFKIILIILVVLIATIGGAGYYLFQEFSKYTSDKPLKLPQKDYNKINQNINQKIERAQKMKVKRVSLNSDELDALLFKTNMELKKVSQLYIRGNAIHLKVSKQVGEKYLNFDLSFKIKNSKEGLSITINNIYLENGKLSKEIEDKLKEFDIVELIQKENPDIFKQIKSIKVISGKAEVILQ